MTKTIRLPLSTSLWCWRWESAQDEEDGVPAMPELRKDVVEWLNRKCVTYSFGLGDDAPNGDNVVDLDFEAEADAEAFAAAWTTS